MPATAGARGGPKGRVRYEVHTYMGRSVGQVCHLQVVCTGHVSGSGRGAGTRARVMTCTGCG